jgi:hypothetical protein
MLLLPAAAATAPAAVPLLLLLLLLLLLHNQSPLVSLDDRHDDLFALPIRSTYRPTTTCITNRGGGALA